MNFSKLSHLALLLVLFIGIGLRFYNLDTKLFWMDEAGSALHIAGYTESEVHAEITSRRVWSPAQVSKFQRLEPAHTFSDAMRALATDDAQHPPLFYALLRVWTSAFGTSVFVMRLLPALLSLFIFPACWWLCRELFYGESQSQKPSANQFSMVALALMAVSPFHVLYAQETREYSLLTVMYLASGALLLRAIRVGGAVAWAAYAVVLAIGFYTHTLFILTWLAHGAIILIFHRQKQKAKSAEPSRLLAAFALSSLVAALLFSPWAILMWQGRAKMESSTGWLSQNSSAWYLIKTWVTIFSALLFDPNHTQRWSGALADSPLVLVVRFLRLVFFGLMVFMLGWTLRAAPRRIAVFIGVLIVVPFAAPALADLLMGGYRSTIARFMIPSFLGVQLALAYFIAAKLAAPRARKSWTAFFGLILCFATGSCFLSSQSRLWWNKSASYEVPQIARALNKEAAPLLVAGWSNNLLSINRLLKPQAKIFFVMEAEGEHFDSAQLAAIKSSAVFFYAPSKTLRAHLQKQGVILKEEGKGSSLWRLAGKNSFMQNP